MPKFSIKAGILLEVLNLVRMKGKNHNGDNVTLIQSCILKINKKNIKIETTDLQEAVFTEVTIKEFNCIEEGLIPVELEKPSNDKKKNTLIDSLERFKSDDEIEVELQYGIIVVKRNKPRLTKKVNTITIDEVNYENEEGIPITYISKNDTWNTDGGRNYTTKIIVDASEFKEVIKDGDQIAHRSYPVMVNSKEVIVSTFDKDSGAGSERELVVVEKDGLRCGTKPIGSLFSYGFGNVFGNLKGKINIWLYQDQAMIIHQDNKSYEYVIVYSSLEAEETECEDVEMESEEIDINEIEIEFEDEELTQDDIDEIYADPDEDIDIIDEESIEPEINDIIEEGEKDIPTKEWTSKQLIEYAVINGIDIEYNNPKEKIFADIMNALDIEIEEELPSEEEGYLPGEKELYDANEGDPSNWNKPELVKLAKIHGVKVTSKMTKSAVLDALMDKTGGNL